MSESGTDAVRICCELPTNSVKIWFKLGANTQRMRRVQVQKYADDSNRIRTKFSSHSIRIRTAFAQNFVQIMDTAMIKFSPN